ncbi:hypothetical protein Pla86_36770 [Planctomycetes bacterium Pla86]|uniref:Uncharacterized protein n=1 Tax=Engelhardtia mirabilis TaxID=2528011 RepID=A0A518BNM0_9BACT|nr:hypothetical protein Pla133_36790 [Planctomycetes bacterium Pla133]QDV02905.1 hypothetical protein Pla86_36770 [Planctomycetes bacterium Pla86]
MEARSGERVAGVLVGGLVGSEIGRVMGEHQLQAYPWGRSAEGRFGPESWACAAAGEYRWATQPERRIQARAAVEATSASSTNTMASRINSTNSS